jgi:cytochrome c oxidase subunit 2
LLNRPLGTIPAAGEAETGGVASGAPHVATLVEQGKEVYEKKGCVACHSVDGSAKVGPTHKGLFGSTVELANGKTLVADENYVRTHIENPSTYTVKGYNAVMPTFKGLISETEMNALIAYMKSLK